MSVAPGRESGMLRAMPLVFVLIWSTGFIVARYGMPNAPPFKFLALRYALSLACFLPWVWWSGVAWPAGRAQWLHLALTGILMHALYLGGVWAAVKAGMGSGLSALIVGLQPVPGLAHSISEVRATYGGVFIGASLYPLLTGAPPAFLTLACCWLFAGVARLASVVVDRAATQFNFIAIAFELGMGVLLALPYRAAFIG